MPTTKFCFVVMPFRPELHFMYLYVQKHLQERHGLQVERGDDRILTKPVLEKIRDQIVKADVIIGDITGRNPNVFYELGLADAYSKPVILLTQDSPAEAPTDVRHLEFIRYELSQHHEFLSRLDNAMDHLFVGRYQDLYDRAVVVLQQFNTESGTTYQRANLETFRERVVAGESAQGLPADGDDYGLIVFLLPKIVANPTDTPTMKRLTDWLAAHSPD